MGRSVQLDCRIAPGNLLQQYYVSWDISGQTIYRTTPNGPPQFVDNRYSHNPSNLSLIISDVQLSDASTQYHCVLSVVDPNTMIERTYNILENFDISLNVLGKCICYHANIMFLYESSPTCNAVTVLLFFLLVSFSYKHLYICMHSYRPTSRNRMGIPSTFT